MHCALLDRLSPRARPGLALAAVGSLLLAGSARAQIIGQVPVSVGPGSGVTRPLDHVDNLILVQQFSTNAIGTIPFAGAATSFIPAINGSTTVHGVKLERGTAPARVFFSTPNGANQDLRRVSVFGGSMVTLMTFTQGGSWMLHEVAPGNTVFFLSRVRPAPANNLIDIVRADTVAGSSRSLVTLDTAALAFSSVADIKVSPNGQTLAIQLNTGSPFNSPVLTASAVAPGAASLSIPTSRTAVRWIDSRFLAFIETLPGLAAPVGVVRADTSTIPATLAALTQSSVQVDPSSALGISDDGQWLSFVVTQTIAGTTEKVPAAMRVSLGASTDPGGAYIPFGDYRTNPATPALTAWNTIENVLIRHTPGAAPNPVVQMHFRGRRAFTDPVDNFAADVRDEIAITPRANPGTAVTFSTTAPPNSVLWGVVVSASRISPPVSLLSGGIFNLQLVGQNQSMFTVPAPPNTLVTVPVTLSSSPLLIGQRLFFQSAWLNGNNSIHLSLASELPVF